MLYKLIHQAFDKEMQQIRFFRQQDINFVSHVITYTIPFHCKPGDVLYDRGDVAEELAFISKGTVRPVAALLTCWLVRCLLACQMRGSDERLRREVQG